MELQDGGTQLRQLVSQLVAKDGNGAHVVPDVEARAVVALLSLAVRKANPKVELNAFVLGTVGTFAVEAKVAPEDPPDAMIRKLENHLIGLLSAQLRTRLETFFREELAQGGADMTRQVADLMGLQRPKGVLDAGVRPQGTVAAGPMARFQVQVPGKK